MTIQLGCCYNYSTSDKQGILQHERVCGLGPLLTSRPRASQPVLEALVEAATLAVRGAGNKRARR